MAEPSKAYYELDPEGDLLLIMRNPSLPFAVWDDDLGSLVDKLDPESQKEKKKKVARPIQSSSQLTFDQAELQLNDFFQNAAESEALETLLPTGETPPEEPYLKLLLSSAHLRLGSGYFKRTLSHGWKEAVTVDADGKRCIEAEDFDAEALLMVMRMIHNLDHSVPEKVDLEMMAKVAVIVDYYDCHEPVWFIASMWINELKDSLPTTCNRDLSLWLLISSVFDEKEVFLKITTTAILMSTGPIRKLDLPIRDIFIDLIDRRRQNAIGLMVNALKDLFSSLRKKPSDCSFECSSRLLGDLLRGTNDLLLPSPEEPYLGYSIKSLEGVLQNIPASASRCYGGQCSLKSKIFSRLKGDFKNCKKGLKLHQFLMPDGVERKKIEETEDDASETDEAMDESFWGP